MSGLLAWAAERYPPANAVILLFVTLVVYAHGHGGLSPGVLPAFAGLWAFYLMVRIIDEHKDFEEDLAAHPDRVLQSGRVTLTELKIIGLAALAVQGAAAAQLGIGWWLITLGWVTWASQDFYVGRWIEGRPVLYPMVHVPLSGLACLWISGDRPLTAGAFWVFALGVLMAVTVDVIRKLKPGEDRSYGSALGPGRARALLAGVLSALAGVLAAVVYTGMRA
jgi:4-hydroxybenzoate polyprenyltransferase